MPQKAEPYWVGSHTRPPSLPGPQVPIYTLWLSSGKGLMDMCTCPWCSLLGRRVLWLNIRGKEASIGSMFHIHTPLPQVSGCAVGGQVLTVPGSFWSSCSQSRVPEIWGVVTRASSSVPRGEPE